jgi:hypothetical protein
MPALLADAIINDVLSPDELAKGIADTWTMAEWPARVIDPTSWSTIFAMAIDEHEFITDDGLIVSSNTIPESLVLYRGAFEEFALGMSWTSDLATARWFARRFNGTRDNPEGHVYTITAERSAVIGRFDARRELEFVLDVTVLFDDDVKMVADVDSVVA